MLTQNNCCIRTLQEGLPAPSEQQSLREMGKVSPHLG